MMLLPISTICIFSLIDSVSSFSIVPVHSPCARLETTSLASTRRDFIHENVGSSVLAVLAVIGPTTSAYASGGATAGGAYLLSAKQRYNDRVESGVKNFLAIKSALDAQDIVAIRYLFSTEDVGSWSDFSSAGYLLSNAFRRNSSAPPDSLPSVKKWKAFAAQVENMTKALKKKDFDSAKTIYSDSLVTLDEYLELVELPNAKDIVKS